MHQQPMVVHYVDWDIVLKCKSGKFASKDECLKSIWTEECAKSIESYNHSSMVQIMCEVLEEILPIEQRAYLFGRILRSGRLNSQADLLYDLYRELQLLNVRESVGVRSFRDLYIIEKKGKYYTIDQYDELKET